jgi:hypothetical protein
VWVGLVILLALAALVGLLGQLVVLGVAVITRSQQERLTRLPREIGHPEEKLHARRDDLRIPYLFFGFHDEKSQRKEGVRGATPVLTIFPHPRTLTNSRADKNLADGEGFEPSVPCGTHAFQACPIDRSGTHPKRAYEFDVD